MKKTICIILATAFAATLQAAVPLAWNVETTRAQPAAFDCYRGETLELRASLYNAGIALDVSGAAASLYWQTNGMGEVYWSAPATAASNVLSATWAPTNDVGAASYNCFIGVAGEIYRAAFRIRMLPSPGAVPSELDLPAKSINFATVTVINPPYYTQGEVDSAIAFEAGAATNYADSVAQSATNYTDSTAASLRNAIAGKADATNTYTKAQMDAAMNGMQRDIAHYGQLAENAVSSVNGKTGNAVTLDAKDIDIFMVKGNVTTNIEYAVNSLDIEMGMTFDAIGRSLSGKQDNLPYPTNAIPYAAITGKPTLATVATSGSYNDLSNKPTIPTVPTNVSAFVNDAGYISSYTETDPVWTAEKGGYATTSALAGKANDADVVHTTGNETIMGNKTFYDGIIMENRADIDFSGGRVIIRSDDSVAVLNHDGIDYSTDGGYNFEHYDWPSASGKIALTAGTGHAGNLAALDANGNPVDSGKSAADFATAGNLATAAVAATNYTDSIASTLRDSIFTAALSATNYIDSATNAIPKFSEKDVVKVYFRDGENYPSYVDGRGELWEIGDLELGGHWVATGGPASSQGTYNYAGHTGGVYGWTLEGNYITYDTSTGVIVHNGSTSTNTPEPGKDPEVIGTTFPTCLNIWASGRTITYYPMAYQYDSKGRFALSNALSQVAFTGNYNDLTGKPTFATVATSGSYNDLTDKPSIPSPTAPVASATLAWQSNGSAIVVSVGAAGTLFATLTGWIEGQTQTALITIAAGASISSEVKLVGYGTWPTGGQFLASATRVGNYVYVTPIVLVN